MPHRKHRRVTAPGDRYLGPIRVPILRECVECHYKPVPVGRNCPNCGRNEIGEDAGLGEANTSGRTARAVQETEDWA